MYEDYIQTTIVELKRLENVKENIDKHIKEKENILKEYMTTKHIEELYGKAGEKVIYREVISNRFDTKSFKEKFESLYELYSKKTKNLRFKFSY